MVLIPCVFPVCAVQKGGRRERDREGTTGSDTCQLNNGGPWQFSLKFIAKNLGSAFSRGFFSQPGAFVDSVVEHVLGAELCVPLQDRSIWLFWNTACCLLASFGDGIVTLAMFPQGCEGTIMHSQLLSNGVGGGQIGLLQGVMFTYDNTATICIAHNSLRAADAAL